MNDLVFWFIVAGICMLAIPILKIILDCFSEICMGGMDEA